MRRRRVCALVVGVVLSGGTYAQTSPATPPADELSPLLSRYCFECHGSRRQRADVNLKEALSQRPLVRNAELWENVRLRLEDEEMPPEDSDLPTNDERAAMVRLIDRSVRHFDYSSIDEPGYETARRLTHREYDNSLRDLFGIDVRPSREFPSDQSGTSGFDNSANTLFLQPILFERYLGAADAVIEAALPAESASDSESRGAKARWRRVLVAEPGGELTADAAARQVLEHFLPRAWRRPVAREEIDELVARFRSVRKSDNDFRDALKKTLVVALVSPHFLLRLEEHEDSAEPYRVKPWELASRISFFLWASTPDEALREAADDGSLDDPDVLDAQVRRMLSDDRAETLGSIFASQWLGSDDLGTRVRLDPIDKPWCTDTLMAAMRDETALFFTTLVRENRPLSELVDAKYTFLNEELARHYDMQGIEGTEMRRVELQDDRRGGIFGHGSLLAVTSFPHRTSPVVRGTWILTDVLGTPPPPPPPDAGELAEEIQDADELSFRQKLEVHRKRKRCAGCHAQIDPLGFSLENYGLFGRWREKRRREPIDARGRLPDGTEFEGPSGLKRVILERRFDDLARQVTRKLLAYALGRQLEWYDEPSVRKIIARWKDAGYRFQTLVAEIVKIYPFQYRKNPSIDEEADEGETRAF